MTPAGIVLIMCNMVVFAPLMWLSGGGPHLHSCVWVRGTVRATTPLNLVQHDSSLTAMTAAWHSPGGAGLPTHILLHDSGLSAMKARKNNGGGAALFSSSVLAGKGCVGRATPPPRPGLQASGTAAPAPRSNSVGGTALGNMSSDTSINIVSLCRTSLAIHPRKYETSSARPSHAGAGRERVARSSRAAATAAALPRAPLQAPPGLSETAGHRHRPPAGPAAARRPRPRGPAGGAPPLPARARRRESVLQPSRTGPAAARSATRPGQTAAAPRAAGRARGRATAAPSSAAARITALGRQARFALALRLPSAPQPRARGPRPRGPPGRAKGRREECGKAVSTRNGSAPTCWARPWPRRSSRKPVSAGEQAAPPQSSPALLAANSRAQYSEMIPATGPGPPNPDRQEVGPRRSSRTRQPPDRLGFGRLRFTASHQSGSAPAPPQQSGAQSTSGSDLTKPKPPPPISPPLPTKERISQGRWRERPNDSPSPPVCSPGPGQAEEEGGGASLATPPRQPGEQEAGEGARPGEVPASPRDLSRDNLDHLVLTSGLGLHQLLLQGQQDGDGASKEAASPSPLQATLPRIPPPSQVMTQSWTATTTEIMSSSQPAEEMRPGAAPPPPPPPLPVPPPSRPPPAPSPPGAPPKGRESARIRARPSVGICLSPPNLSDQSLQGVVSDHWLGTRSTERGRTPMQTPYGPGWGRRTRWSSDYSDNDATGTWEQEREPRRAWRDVAAAPHQRERTPRPADQQELLENLSGLLSRERKGEQQPRLSSSLPAPTARSPTRAEPGPPHQKSTCLGSGWSGGQPGQPEGCKDGLESLSWRITSASCGGTTGGPGLTQPDSTRPLSAAEISCNVPPAMNPSHYATTEQERPGGPRRAGSAATRQHQSAGGGRPDQTPGQPPHPHPHQASQTTPSSSLQAVSPAQLPFPSFSQNRNVSNLPAHTAPYSLSGAGPASLPRNQRLLELNISPIRPCNGSTRELRDSPWQQRSASTPCSSSLQKKSGLSGLSLPSAHKENRSCWTTPRLAPRPALPTLSEYPECEEMEAASQVPPSMAATIASQRKQTERNNMQQNSFRSHPINTYSNPARTGEGRVLNPPGLMWGSTMETSWKTPPMTAKLFPEMDGEGQRQMMCSAYQIFPALFLQNNPNSFFIKWTATHCLGSPDPNRTHSSFLKHYFPSLNENQLEEFGPDPAGFANLLRLFRESVHPENPNKLSDDDLAAIQKGSSDPSLATFSAWLLRFTQSPLTNMAHTYVEAMERLAEVPNYLAYKARNCQAALVEYENFINRSTALETAAVAFTASQIDYQQAAQAVLDYQNQREALLQPLNTFRTHSLTDQILCSVRGNLTSTAASSRAEEALECWQILGKQADTSMIGLLRSAEQGRWRELHWVGPTTNGLPAFGDIDVDRDAAQIGNIMQCYQDSQQKDRLAREQQLLAIQQQQAFSGQANLTIPVVPNNSPMPPSSGAHSLTQPLPGSPFLHQRTENQSAPPALPAFSHSGNAQQPAPAPTSNPASAFFGNFGPGAAVTSSSGLSAPISYAPPPPGLHLPAQPHTSAASAFPLHGGGAGYMASVGGGAVGGHAAGQGLDGGAGGGGGAGGFLPPPPTRHAAGLPGTDGGGGGGGGGDPPDRAGAGGGSGGRPYGGGGGGGGDGGGGGGGGDGGGPPPHRGGGGVN